MFWATQQPEPASEQFQAALELLRPLADSSPGVPEYQHETAVTLGNLALVARQRHDLGQARALLAPGLPYHQAAVKGSPTNPAFQEFLHTNRPHFALTLADLGEHTAATWTIEEAVHVGSESTASAYQTACVLALCVRAAEHDAKLPEGQRKEQARAYADAAMKWLSAAADHGFKDLKQLRKDTELDALRWRPDFEALVQRLEMK